METGCLLHCLEVEETNVFEAVKQSVTTRQAALVYGISVGRNGMACCPFHDDRHPSMKVDRRFHCFACQADGDVIDFTSRLFGLSSKEAALKLAEDFSISFDRKGHDPPQKRVIKRKISEEMRYRQAEQKCFRVLCDYLRLLERWKEEYAPMQLAENAGAQGHLKGIQYIAILVHPHCTDLDDLTPQGQLRPMIIKGFGRIAHVPFQVKNDQVHCGSSKMNFSTASPTPSCSLSAVTYLAACFTSGTALPMATPMPA